MLKKSTSIIIYIFSFVLVMFSTYSLSINDGSLQTIIGQYLHSGVFHRAFFTPFELIIIILLTNILINNKIGLKFNNKLFLFAIIAYITRMINPNSDTLNSIFGMPLFTNLDEYIFLFALIVLISIPPFLIGLIIEKIFKTVLIFSTIRAFILIVAYFTGALNFFRFDIAIMLPEPDTQFLFSFLGSLLFTLYLLRQKNKYLLLSALFFFVVTFSMQRSTTFAGFIAVFFVMIVSIFKVLPLAASRSFMIICLLLIIFQLSLTQFESSKMAFTINRYLGIAKNTNDVSDLAFSDTGHKEQAFAVFASVMKTKPFWGIGYGKTNERLYLEGQSTNIHNTYATLWAQHGIITLLFYMFIFGQIIKYTLKLVSKLNRDNFSRYLINLSVGFYLVGYFISAWVNSGNVFMSSRLMIFWLMMFIYLIKSPEINFNKFEYGKLK